LIDIDLCRNLLFVSIAFNGRQGLVSIADTASAIIYCLAAIDSDPGELSHSSAYVLFDIDFIYLLRIEELLGITQVNT